MNYSSYRSLLYVPADQPRFIEKSKETPCDMVIFDWEDAISPEAKPGARNTLIETLSHGYDRDYLIRINAADTEFFKDDIQVLLELEPIGVVLPKADEESVEKTSAELDLIEQHSDKSLKLIPLIETAIAIETMLSLLKASSRIAAAQLGAEDLTADLGISRTPEGKEIEYARHRIVYGCRSLGLPAYDTPFLNYSDADGLEADCVVARSIGFGGKVCIHPAQTEIVNRAFSPSDSEVEEARRLLVTAGEINKVDGGAFSVDGKMIDGPVLQRARQILKQTGQL